MNGRAGQNKIRLEPPADVLRLNRNIVYYSPDTLKNLNENPPSPRPSRAHVLKVARRQARSREQEETFLKGVSASIEESASNPWARICDLVDLQKPIVSLKPTSSFSSAGGGAGGTSGAGSGSRRGSATAQTKGLDEEDVFRATEKMRSLIIQVGGQGEGALSRCGGRLRRCCRL